MGAWIKDLLAKEAAKEALRFIAPLLVAIGLAALGSFSLTGLLGVTLWVTVPLFLLLTVVFGIAAVAIYRRMFSFRPSFPPLRPDFRVKSATIRYEYRAIDRMRYSRKWTLQARRDGLDRLTDKYSWTGTGSVQLSAPLNGQDVQHRDRRGVWQQYDILFGRQISKGDEIDVEVVWDLEDTLETAVDFFSTSIDKPTDKLEMIFRAYQGSRIEDVLLERCRTLELDQAYWTEARRPDDDRLVRWEIRKPTFGHHYRVSWNDPDRSGPNLD